MRELLTYHESLESGYIPLQCVFLEREFGAIENANGDKYSERILDWVKLKRERDWVLWHLHRGEHVEYYYYLEWHAR